MSDEAKPEFTALQFAQAGLSLDDWLAYRDRFGHLCCNCPKQRVPMPCCNAGHAEYVARRAEFDAIVGGPTEEER